MPPMNRKPKVPAASQKPTIHGPMAKERDAANAHSKEVETRLSDASKLASPARSANEKIDALTKSRDAANQHVGDLEKQLAATSETAAKLADAQKQIAALSADKSDVPKKMAKFPRSSPMPASRSINSPRIATSALKQVDKLNGKLADAAKEIVSVKGERDQIAAQRDQALADLKKARDASKHVDQLIAQNAELMQKVAADEKIIQQFRTDSPQKDKQIADLRKEVSDTKAMLTATQHDRDNLQSTLSELQQQYDSTTAELADLKANSAVSSSEKKTLTDENDLLRGIVLRELKQQARRDQAKRLVMSELSQLQVQSDTLLQQINLLGQPVVQLTEKEKGLFKDPWFDIPDADETVPAISIAAPKRSAANSSPVPAAAEDPAPRIPAPLPLPLLLPHPLPPGPPLLWNSPAGPLPAQPPKPSPTLPPRPPPLRRKARTANQSAFPPVKRFQPI